MKIKLDDTKPIFLQIKEMLEDSIISNTLKEGDRVPSTNELAAHYKINPATAAKGINELVAEEILYKRRGVGMFVAENARNILLEKHQANFYEEYIRPLKQAAQKLDIDKDELLKMLQREDS
ncbi:GntR family transcriptional regulator [Oceanobacillus luteolus]|uniref:GntR family transcriptional regulator n=1 Tax=Oceanobacillus luteolus TaxID=1274358 RepID=A0ABW4HNU1_9BACI|nr:GntR family transcriptional regulator [Oceanobacillus luteolus]MCM3739519.1 GntR family transcriptional regulator [Oceanobacillus luteolus]